MSALYYKLRVRRSRLGKEPFDGVRVRPTSEPPTLRSTLRRPPGRIKGATRHCVMASGHP